jgi:agmatinase
MKRTILPDARRTPRFAGLVTFGRYPRLEDVLPENGPPDWAIYGVPFDSGVTYRPGARFGPRAIRVESQYLKRYHVDHDIDVCDALSLADAGDAPVEPYDCELNARSHAAFAKGLGRPGETKLLALGGDHTTAYGNLRATWERLGGGAGKARGGLAVVHFDAHLDTVDSVWGERWGHASVFRRAIEDGLIDPAAMISLGIRGPLNTRDDLEFARDHGIQVVTADRLETQGEASIRAFVERLGVRPVYITFDIDCIDPAFAPGTGTPSPGGMSSALAFSLLRRLRGVRVAGADVVEVLPDRDVSGVTALLAAHIAFEILSLDAVARRDAGATPPRAAKPREAAHGARVRAPGKPGKAR